MPRQTSAGPYLITETPGLIECRSCRAAIMTAVVGGLERKIDTAAINMAGELTALIGGRATFSLYGERLFRRNADKIRSGDRQYPVFPEHRCGQPVPQEHLDNVWMEVAIAIIVQACGGVIVSRQDPTPSKPPF